jgi:hypothetical protein
MVREPFGGAVSVSGKDGRKEGLMLSGHVSFDATAQWKRPAAVEFSRIAQRTCDLLEPSVGTPVQQGAMEFGMFGDPLVGEAIGIGRVELRCPAKTMVRRQDSRFPIEVPLNDGRAKDQGLKDDSGVSEIAQILHGEIDDLESLLRFALNEALFGEAQHGFSQDAGACLVVAAQFGVTKA